MSDTDRFAALLTRTGVGIPRGILGEEARDLARAVAAGDDAPHEGLRQAAAELHWPAIRGAMGAGLRRARASGVEDPAFDEAIALTEDPDHGNPFARVLIDDAVWQLAAVITRSHERLTVLDQRLADDTAGDDVSRTVGDIVSDLLDLDVEDYEDEIATFVQGGESDASRRELARSTGDDEMREWARSELAWITDGSSTTSGAALSAMARGPLPEDPSEDPVWMSTILALVEEAVELVQVDDLMSETEATGPANGAGDDWSMDGAED